MGRRFAAWIRYGWPVTDEQVAFAVEHYALAVLQPWETDVLHRLKAGRPDMVVLAYKCLSSTRSYEPGPLYSSGVSFAEAQAQGGDWFARRRRRGPRIEWRGYEGHWQMKVWDAGYRQRWVENVTTEIAGTPWDGVMADNDVYDDYYGLEPPRTGRSTMHGIRRSLGRLVDEAGESLTGAGKLLVPNIAESRREPGRWQRHAAYGGGFEEVFLAWAPDQFLDRYAALAQGAQLQGPGLGVVHVVTDGTQGHPNVRYGLAAFWVLGGGRDGTSFAATAHDAYSGTPWLPELGWDLGEPLGDVLPVGSTVQRAFRGGWVAAHLGAADEGAALLPVPPGLTDADGRPAPDAVRLEPHHGALFAGAVDPAWGPRP